MSTKGSVLLMLTVMGVSILLASGVALAVATKGTYEDNVVKGTSGPDTLYGRGGDDTLIAGPKTDAATDKLYGGAGEDNIKAANDPASKDIVTCGAGYDRVFVDTYDQVDKDCEDITTKLTAEEEALQGPPPPAVDPSSPTPDDNVSGEATNPASESDTVNTRSFAASTSCRKRTDRPHRSKSAKPIYSEALSKSGVNKCDVKKYRIWVDMALQRWVPYDNPRWIDVRNIRDSDYGTRENVKALAYHCPVVRAYWYRSVVRRATVVDYDGDRHELNTPRYSDLRRFKCERK